MARRLRIEYPGAIHHVLNRGSEGRFLFENVEAAEIFLATLFETAATYGWVIHAYVLMPDHFHLAVTTPVPTLADGMHWLQSTLVTRFNRSFGKNGPLFQGRYKSLLVEDRIALCRVVDSIHLNPLRAGLVTPGQIGAYRWSSLRRFAKGPVHPTMDAGAWLGLRTGGSDADDPLECYEKALVELAQDEPRWAREGLTGLSRGWAIGSDSWRTALVADRPGYRGDSDQPVATEDREAVWQLGFERALAASGRSLPDLETKPLKTEWKVELAGQVRAETGASVSWLAQRLKIGGSGTLRSYLSRSAQAKRI